MYKSMNKHLKTGLSTLVFSIFVVIGSSMNFVLAYGNESHNKVESGITTPIHNRIEKKKEAAIRQRDTQLVQAEKRLKISERKIEPKYKDANTESCEAKSIVLSNKIKSTSAVAERQVEQIDNLNEKMIKFVVSNSLEVNNYTEKQQAVVDAQSAATETVTVLKEYLTEIDCNNIDRATAANFGYEDALNDDKEAILNYRELTTDLLIEVRSAALKKANGVPNSTDGEDISDDPSTETGSGTSSESETDQSTNTDTEATSNEGNTRDNETS